jgi:hypothetical protein
MAKTVQAAKFRATWEPDAATLRKISEVVGFRLEGATLFVAENHEVDMLDFSKVTAASRIMEQRIGALRATGLVTRHSSRTGAVHPEELFGAEEPEDNPGGVDVTEQTGGEYGGA